MSERETDNAPPRKPRQGGPRKGAKYHLRDPLHSYLRSAGDRYTFGLLPDGSKIDSPEDLNRELAERVHVLTGQLYPRLNDKDKPHVRSITAALGVPQRTIWDIMAGRAPTRTTKQYLFLLLGHLKGIADHLHDCEREIWILMQICHDPRLDDTEPRMPDGRNRAEGRRRKALHDKRKARAAGKELPQAAYWLPERLIQLTETDGETSP